MSGNLIERELSPETLQLLFENVIPCIRVPAFATGTECAALAAAVKTSSLLRQYSSTSDESPAYFIGASQFEYRQGGDRKNDFFDDVAAVEPKIRELFIRSFDPVERLRHSLSSFGYSRVNTARESDGHTYGSCIIRITSAGFHAHVDFAPFSSPRWAIGDIDAQITWSLYLEAPAEGGETTVFNRPWQLDEVEDAEMGLPSGDLSNDSNVQSFTFAPTVGDVVLFNSRNPHMGGPSARSPSSTERISVGSFVGRREPDELILWG